LPKPKVKIRGVYSTALTKLLLDAGFGIVQPSALICQRFHLQPNSGLEEISVYDGGDLHSIIAEGKGKEVEKVIEALTGNIPDVIVRSTSAQPQQLQDLQGLKLSWQEFVTKLGTRADFIMEFTYTSKIALDAIRASVTPTIPQHHLLKLINAQKVDEVEAASAYIDKAKNLKEELIYSHYHLGRTVLLEHVLLEGKVLTMKGRLTEFDSEQGLAYIKRSFSGTGKYDGLNVSQKEGDWGIIEAKEGSWICKRTYYRQDGDLIGELYNINTGIELYPDKIRYFDLKVDVVKWAEGKVKMIDRSELYQAVKDGLVSEQLAQKGLAVAEELSHSLKMG